MPIYEYKCGNGHVFDIMQRMSEDPLTECVECGAPVRKVLHPVGISFKCSGCYSTDYSNSNSKTDSKETTKTESTDSSNGNGSEKKSEKASSTESTAKKAD